MTLPEDFFYKGIIGTATLGVSYQTYKQCRIANQTKFRLEHLEHSKALKAETITPFMYASLRHKAGAQPAQITAEMQCWSRQGTMTKEKAKFVKARDNVELVFHDTGNKKFLVEFKNKDSELPFSSITFKQKRSSSIYGVISTEELTELHEHFKALAEQSYSRLETMLEQNVAEPKFTYCSELKARYPQIPPTVTPLIPLMLVLALLAFLTFRKPKG